MTAAARAALRAVRGYQRAVSPLLGDNCRFLPSCSEYAAMCLEDWGLLRGGWLAIRRVARCHPFHPGGLDLPPRPSCCTPGEDAAPASLHAPFAGPQHGPLPR